MAQYPHLVQLSWHAVEQLINDWSKNPHYWEREIDIQSELKGRLTTLFSLIGYGEVSFEKVSPSPTGGAQTFRYSRVACEPSINFEYSDGRPYRAMPDIVVWDVLDDPKTQPDEGWPILWACEIKYKNSSVTAEWDVEKLGYLLEQKRIKFGCWLVFRIDNSLKKPSISWEKSAHGRHLWKCTALAPSIMGTREI